MIPDLDPHQMSMFDISPDARRLTGSVDALVGYDTPLTWPAWVAPIDRRFALAFGVRIDGEPHGKGSVRVVQRRDKLTGDLKSQGRPAPRSRAYEDLLALLARSQTLRKGFERPLMGALIVRVLAVKSRPKTLPAEAIPYIDSDLDGRRYCPVTPDWDNVGKSVGDGLKRGGVMRDDAQFVDGRVTTLYAAVNEDPFVETFIWGIR